MTFGEFLGWLGCLFVMKVPLVHKSRDLFSTKPRKQCWNPSCLDDIMSGMRFDRFNECLKLHHEEEAPDHRDKLFWIEEMTKCFN